MSKSIAPKSKRNTVDADTLRDAESKAKANMYAAELRLTKAEHSLVLARRAADAARAAHREAEQALEGL